MTSKADGSISSKKRERREPEKPKAGRVRNPVTGKWMLLGCKEAARWLVETRKIARISVTTVRAIAEGRGELLNYNFETVKLVRREFPELCGVSETQTKTER